MFFKPAKTEQTKKVNQGNGTPRTPLRFLWYTVKPYRYWLLLGVSLNIINQLLSVYVAIFIGNLADAAAKVSEPEQFLSWVIGFLVLIVSTFIFYRVGGFITIHFVLKQNQYAFETVKGYLLKHSHTYYIDRFAGTLTGKIFNAGDRSSEILLMINYGFVRLVVSLTATGVVIGFFSIKLTLIYAAIVFLTILVNIYLVKRRRPLVVDYAKTTSRYRGQLTDVVSNIQAVRQFSAINSEFDYLKQTLSERVLKDRKQWTVGEWNHVVNNILTTLLMVLMIGGTYILLINGSVTLGAMVSVMILMYRVSGIMVDLGDWMNRIIRIYGDVEEGLDDILVDHEIVDEPGAGLLKAEEGRIQFNNVTFQYGENCIFKDFNLTIEPGQRVGLVGSSGAGKTTLISLLLRQHDIQEGEINIDGQNISSVTQDSLRENIAIVPQEPILFHRSIRENIIYGKPNATEEEIIAVAKKAQAHDFIMQLSEGYDTLVGERGVKLSGGQKQRVAIARAMLKEAPILVLDEATSALDSESEVAIQKALSELMKGKTVLAIAHRLSTLREMDRILVLESGTIIEDGTHRELAKGGCTYQKLWEHQAGGFLQE